MKAAARTPAICAAALLLATAGGFAVRAQGIDNSPYGGYASPQNAPAPGGYGNVPDSSSVYGGTGGTYTGQASPQPYIPPSYDPSQPGGYTQAAPPQPYPPQPGYAQPQQQPYPPQPGYAQPQQQPYPPQPGYAQPQQQPYPAQPGYAQPQQQPYPAQSGAQPPMPAPSGPAVTYLPPATTGAIPGGPNITTVMNNSGKFKTFLKIADAAGFTDALNRGGPYTAFAPTDDAFARLPAGTVANLLRSQSTAVSFVRFHLVDGIVRVADLVRGGQTVRTLQGNTLQIGMRSDHVTVNGAEIIQPDLPAGNGMVQGLAAFALPVYIDPEDGRRDPNAGGRSDAAPPTRSQPSPAPSTGTPAAPRPASGAWDGPAYYN